MEQAEHNLLAGEITFGDYAKECGVPIRDGEAVEISIGIGNNSGTKARAAIEAYEAAKSAAQPDDCMLNHIKDMVVAHNMSHEPFCDGGAWKDDFQECAKRAEAYAKSINALESGEVERLRDAINHALDAIAAYPEHPMTASEVILNQAIFGHRKSKQIEVGGSDE